MLNDTTNFDQIFQTGDTIGILIGGICVFVGLLYGIYTEIRQFDKKNQNKY